MKNTYLTTAEKAKAELSQIALKREALEKRAKFLRDVIAFAEGDDDSDDSAPSIDVQEKTVSQAAHPKTKQATVSSFCEGFLSKTGPASGATLYDAIINAGIALTGADRDRQMINMAGYLNNAGKLRYYPEHRHWWFVDQPYPKSKRLFLIDDDDQDVI